jgi:ApaG protein
MTRISTSKPSRGSETLTYGVRVRVAPTFVPDQAESEHRSYVFTYRVRICNESPRTVQLVSRRWQIVNASGTSHIVQGEGVVGQQPVLEPGQTFEYSSYCPLDTPWGTMEGHFTLRREDGQNFDVPVGRFFLVSEQTPRRAAVRPSIRV